MGTKAATIIEPSRSLSLGLKEFREYRDLLYFLVLRDIKARYAQSILGVGWAVIQPVFPMIIFTVIFGRVARIGSDGIPYPVFSYAALVPWTYFANTLVEASGSLVRNGPMLSKIYFPRLIIPLTPVAAKLLDFGVSFLLLTPLMLWFGVSPTAWTLLLPVLVLVLIGFTAGLSLWLAPLAIQYRDVNHGLRFAVQLLMYLAPVVYPTSRIPESYRLLYGLNPMVGIIEGFRSVLTGATPIPWDLLLLSGAVSALLLITGAFYFRRRESIFADVV